MKTEAYGKILTALLLSGEVDMKKYLLFIFITSMLLCNCSFNDEAVQVRNSGKPKKLTVMVYMAADNDLESFALENLKAMEAADCKDTNVLVLLDRSDEYDETNGNWTDSRLFQVIHDGSGDNTIKSKRLSCPQLGLLESENTELDMASPKTLQHFIEYGKKNFEADNYALIIWGHGSGWKAFCIDDRTDSFMTVKELGDAVRGQGLCVIGFDTCFGCVFENIYELKDCAEYTVACPGVTDGRGWNYKTLLEKLSSAGTSAYDIAGAMAVNSYTQNTIIDNSKVEELFISFEDFAKQLADRILERDTQYSVFNSLCNCKSYFSNHNPCEIYLDIYSMAELYSFDFDSCINPRLKESAEELKKKINKTCLSTQNTNGEIGIHFIPKTASGAFATTHSIDYIKDSRRNDQSSFIQKSQYWVPTIKGNSCSILDKLFYTSF